MKGDATLKNDQLKNKAFKGAFWKFAERICAQLVSAIVAVVLARLLTPEDYSVVSVVTIFFTFASILISGGLNTALIQKKDSDILDYSTVLISSVVLSVVMYLVMFFAAPVISVWYEKPLLIPIIRVMSLTLLINAVKGTVCANISSNLKFKDFFWATIIGTVISAFIGIYMAVKGAGAWALVAQQMSNALIDTVLLILITRVRFIARFSFERFKTLFSYSYKLFLSSMINAIYNDIRPLIVGLKFSSVDLAFYNKGKSYPQLINSTVTDTLASVLFPVMSKVQEEHDQLVAMTRRFIRVCSYVIFPIMLGLFATAENFTIILLTAKWLDIVIYIRIFCVALMLNIVQVGNLQAIKAIGRSDIYLKLEIIKKVFYAVVIVVTVLVTDSPQVLAATSIINVIFATVVNTSANRTLFGYRFRDQMWDVAQNLIPAAIMCAAVWLMNSLPLNIYLLFPLQIFGGIGLYIFIGRIMKNTSLDYLIHFVKSKIKKKA